MNSKDAITVVIRNRFRRLDLEMDENHLNPTEIEITCNLDGTDLRVRPTGHCSPGANYEKGHLALPDWDTGQCYLLVEVVPAPDGPREIQGKYPQRPILQPKAPEDSEKLLQYLRYCAFRLPQKSP